ncbi:hypothetical protein CDD82_6974 [Ophiocordyceps australis]|uniref:DUF7907 domain-containing protein n=1 Tax=Ophiocordyceps australis TaxID=1399860 RepID=A0A2C5YSG7_9HYPO|nr:hypothetical protein CDD82_6974 [Ophiocordyceps australis]
MKLAPLHTCLVLGAMAATAQDIQSSPFQLVIQSVQDETLNGHRITACHIGGAIDSMCLAEADGATFFSNTSQGLLSPLEGYEPASVLVWNFAGASRSISKPMSFYHDPSTNVAMPLFHAGYASRQQVTFDKAGRLAIISHMDDSKHPPAFKAKALQNWFVCKNYENTSKRMSLAWVVGRGDVSPQNPTCVKVRVYRKYVSKGLKRQKQGRWKKKSSRGESKLRQS